MYRACKCVRAFGPECVHVCGAVFCIFRNGGGRGGASGGVGGRGGGSGNYSGIGGGRNIFWHDALPTDSAIIVFIEKALRMNLRTNGPKDGWTYRRSDPLIEMRGPI